MEPIPTPKNVDEVIDNWKGMLDVVKDYQEPTKPVASSSAGQNFISSPVFIAILLVIAAMIISLLIYIYKNR